MDGTEVAAVYVRILMRCRNPSCYSEKDSGRGARAKSSPARDSVGVPERRVKGAASPKSFPCRTLRRGRLVGKANAYSLSQGSKVRWSAIGKSASFIAPEARARGVLYAHQFRIV